MPFELRCKKLTRLFKIHPLGRRTAIPTKVDAIVDAELTLARPFLANSQVESPAAFLAEMFQRADFDQNRQR